jgi:DNA-binding response OmpR family regulator
LAEQGVRRILVADDDPVIVRLLQVNFKLEGYEVDTAVHGEEALTKARETSPDLILLDVMMPGVDGWEVCRQLKEDATTRDIPVLFLSARAQEEDRRRGLELGVTDYVTKPFDPGELVALVERCLKDRQQSKPGDTGPGGGPPPDLTRQV